MKRLESLWWDRNGFALALLPLSWLFCLLVKIRRLLYRLRIFKTHHLSVPVVVVGNITVGGAGKTPLVIWLAEHFKELGLKPGIISRGYGGSAEYWPQQVVPGSDPAAVGDEPVLISQRTNCPVSVGPDRVAAAMAIQRYLDCDVIISDDGLQHYALGRDVEIVVIDGERGFGNEYCLPAGPLRENVSRLKSVDMVVSNGTTGPGRFIMQLGNIKVINLLDPTQSKKLDDFKTEKMVYAVAGIGNSERFFKQLENAGIKIERMGFPDHHKYSEDDLKIAGDTPLLMTEKDAVKCRRFARANHWYVQVDALLHDTFAIRINKLMKDIIDG